MQKRELNYHVNPITPMGVLLREVRLRRDAMKSECGKFLILELVNTHLLKSALNSYTFIMSRT